MTTLNVSSAILNVYPETSPFDLDPIPYNLTPASPHTAGDTEAFRTAAREVARITAENPLWQSYGSNPLLIYDPRLLAAKLPLSNYKPPPPMEKATLSEKLVFLERINPNGNAPLFTVRIGDTIRLLKVFPDRPTCLEGYSKPEAAPPHPLIRFKAEKAAYEHLMHNGACAKGVVPHCYGWLELSADDMDSIASMPDISIDLTTLKSDDGPPMALLLEYFEGAVQVSIDNITVAIAEAALRALCGIHAAYILHNDAGSRNCLVLPSGRVVWVDFDSSITIQTAMFQVQRQSFLMELSGVWTHFYSGLLPDKRIGFRHWLY